MNNTARGNWRRGDRGVRGRPSHVEPCVGDWLPRERGGTVPGPGFEDNPCPGESGRFELNTVGAAVRADRREGPLVGRVDRAGECHGLRHTTPERVRGPALTGA